MELVVVFILFGLLGAVLISMNALLGPRKTNPVKERPFECGSPPLQDDIGPFPVKFYLVALIFLLFDIEVVFFFPWALVFREMRGDAFVLMLVYAGVLVAAFAYAWKKGALTWE
jgi:NADH-quinone oxidoreductase subunit A